jgi:hypothetical protein
VLALGDALDLAAGDLGRRQVHGNVFPIGPAILGPGLELPLGLLDDFFLAVALITLDALIYVQANIMKLVVELQFYNLGT